MPKITQFLYVSQFSQTVVEYTCFAQHDRITTNAHQLRNKSDDDEKFSEKKLKPKIESKFGRSSSHSPFSLWLKSVSKFGTTTDEEANAAATDYIIYFKQLTVCQSDKTNFWSKIRKFH